MFMQLKRFVIIQFLFVGLITMGSCSGNDNIRFKTEEMKKRIPLLALNDTTLPYAEVSISFTHPVKFKDKTSLARLQQIVTGTFFNDLRYDSLAPREAISLYIETYSEKYRSLSNKYYEDKSLLNGEPPAWYWYTLDLRNKVLYVNDSLLSLAIEFSDYEGGAHGSYTITYTNINLNQLYTLSEEDVFIPGYFKPLTEKIVNQLMADYNVTNPDSLLMQGFFNIEDIIPNNNFWLSDSAIHYTYNQYEIAPYSMGPISVTIPYTRLRDILSPNGAIGQYYNVPN